MFKCTLAHGQIETIRTIQQLADLVCFRLDSGRGRGMGKSYIRQPPFSPSRGLDLVVAFRFLSSGADVGDIAWPSRCASGFEIHALFHMRRGTTPGARPNCGFLRCAHAEMHALYICSMHACKRARACTLSFCAFACKVHTQQPVVVVVCL